MLSFKQSLEKQWFDNTTCYMDINLLFLIFQPIPWKLPLGELHSRGLQQCLHHVHLLHCQWEVQRKCSSLGGKKSSNLLKFSIIIIKCCLYLIVFATANAGAQLFTFSIVCCVSGFQEGTKSFSIFLQMCDGSRSGRWTGWSYSEGTNCASSLYGPLFQQSGVYHYTDIL